MKPLGWVRKLIWPAADPGVVGVEPEEAIRSELFSVERLESHAASLAVAQTVALDPLWAKRLPERVEANGRRLLACYRAIAETVAQEQAITPAAEWLVDNFYVVQDQLREVREDLPPAFYRTLPKLAAGPLAGYPRVYGIAWAFVAHLDGRFDPDALRRFVSAYQVTDVLGIGELWAIPITLRIVLIENLRRLAEMVVNERAARHQADQFADRLLGLSTDPARKQGPGRAPLPPVDESLSAYDGVPLARAFLVELVQRLRDRDPAVTPGLRWLDARMLAEGTTAEQLVLAEHQSQAAASITVKNCITSMRLMSAFDWAGFFESVSLVDRRLRRSTGFGAMDFATRDRYRQAIEELAIGSAHTELEITERVVALAAGHASGERASDPGYHLVARGRFAFERDLGFEVPLRLRLLRLYVRFAGVAYPASIVALTAVILALPGGLIADSLGPWWAAVLGFLALFPASDLATALINRTVTAVVGPRLLPKLELVDGVPEDLRTLVAVPTMLTGRHQIEEQVERLEVQFLGNDDGDFRFALVTDWTDAATATIPGDDALLDAARDGIRELNARHGPAVAGGDRFFLLHRRRLWNQAERCFMGWERKRGKLLELNRLLRGAEDTSFLLPANDSSAVPTGVRYVITLDADTRLPRGTALKLVATLAHPLNCPRFDPVRGRVVEGHAVLQPRVTPTLPAAGSGSLFQRAFSGPSGVDPYAAAISDVYQDLFGEGSYTGKGIYDIDVFERALGGLVSDNAVLSHDLLEGIFARAGLVTDVEVLEEFPSSYAESAARQHRWARGDWQLLPWLLRVARRATAPRVRARIPWMAAWKILDNLRRTLSAPASLLLLVTAWLLPSPLPLAATLFVIVAMALPPLLDVVSAAIPRRRGISPRRHLRELRPDIATAGLQFVLALTFLADQAWIMTDAIARTLWRLLISRRHLLEWITAAAQKAALAAGVGGRYRRMPWSTGIAAVAAVTLAVSSRDGQIAGAPLVLLWAIAPLIASRVSQVRPGTARAPMSPDAIRFLRRTARRTWRYFETFVGPDTHALPPDNFQEDPKPVVALRTSPTNIGLYVLSTIAAHDSGWSGTLATIERLQATFASLAKLERFRGHLYNWYDLRELQPLEPRYVSTVDSGNLAGHLIAAGEACRELRECPIVGPQTLRGIEDALLLVREAWSRLPAERRVDTVRRNELEEAIDAVESLLRPAPDSPAAWSERLAAISACADTLVDIVLTLSDDGRASDVAEVLAWSEALRRTVKSWMRDVRELLPWASLDSADSPALAAIGEGVPTPLELLALCDAALRDGVLPDPLSRAVAGSRRACEQLCRDAAALHSEVSAQVAAMDFGFLYQPELKLFSIGYQVESHSLDPSSYDLLASEACLGSFLAIAKGDVETAHWFRLGRPLTDIGGASALVSWSGSMFEYAMPLLVLRVPPGSLLDRTAAAVVSRQIRYGRERGVPWGVSESASSVRDRELTYQYSAFGVPGLGLKRGLSDDVVIAPYASALAAMVDPASAVRNLEHLTEIGACGKYGFYDAVDYTRERLPAGTDHTIVATFMAHHQGMSIVAIANVLDEGRIRDRFHASPTVRSAELLLQERTPRGVAVARFRAEEVEAPVRVQDLSPPLPRVFHRPDDPTPRTHLLSNGRYAVMVTAAGSGRSVWRELDVTRWREDPTCDPWGSYVFLRDVDTGALWSAGYQPTAVEPSSYEVAFSEDRAEIKRRDGTIDTTLEIVVSPEDDAEVRRVTLENRGAHARHIEVTSYAEVVLAAAATDVMHPAFSNLFIETAYDPGCGGVLLATRRPRAPDERMVWLAHAVGVTGDAVGPAQYETDRARFLGRGRSLRDAAAVTSGRPLSNTVGTVLDPIMSLRRRVVVRPGEAVRVVCAPLAANTRAEALGLAEKYCEVGIFNRTAALAWTQARVQLRHLAVTTDEAQVFQRLATRIIYSDPTLRAAAEVLERSNRGRGALWAHGISGDLPIVLGRIESLDDQVTVRHLLRAHEYWRMKRLAVDLVILNERPASYAQNLQGALEALVRSSAHAIPEGEVEGKVYLLRKDLLPVEDLDVLRQAARAIIVARPGSLAAQVVRSRHVDRPPALPFPKAPVPERGAATSPIPDLEQWNGLGGFAGAGREYVTVLGEGQWTPAPWLNVVANSGFGFQVSESGSGFTWSENSRENRLTPWSNDRVSDPAGEALYVRDEDTGELWGPTALPIREQSGSYTATHGQGYSRFERTAHGIELDLVQFVPETSPVKVSRLKLTNRSRRARRLSVTSYVEWVLGVERAACAPYTITEIDPATGALLARNSWSTDFPHRIAFSDLHVRPSGGSGAGSTEPASVTGDRTHFIGRNGSLARPAALRAPRPLSGLVGSGLDPCGALQVVVDIEDGGSAEVVFLLGQGESREQATSLVERYRRADLDAELGAVTRRWDDTLGALEVSTPDRALDLLVNRWLLYQTLGCRMWARSACYQSGGAFGFRDQLQDAMALAVARPEVAAEHLVRAAARQFVEGDVQHWWHPPSGRGVRTRISDNRLWLPFAVAHYVQATGDQAILDQTVPFLEGPQLEDGHADLYLEPSIAAETGSLFEHCARAIDRSLELGTHGLPLMGSGDWNDGMNLVGHLGRGESVWLGWFLAAVLDDLTPIAQRRGDAARASRWREHRVRLQAALESSGWDGEWYRRAYFDDGTALGSAASSECRIDSIAQSWSVLSGVAEPGRAAAAMAAVDQHLVRPDAGLVCLFTPPFESGPLEPGYIKGYPPGVRENGGQYTHAATWNVIAFAALGDGDRAAATFALLNPIGHTGTRADVHRYKVEPYVVAADVASEPPHVGRGGWTWYTGAAGWMYRAAVEWILGFRLRGASVRIDPCIPRAWTGFGLRFRYHSATYDIAIEKRSEVCRGVTALELDARSLPVDPPEFALVDDGAVHRVRVVVG